MIPFSTIDSIICTVKNWLDAFTIRNKTTTMNDVANDKSRAAIDANGDDHSKSFVYIFRSDMEQLFAVL